MASPIQRIDGKAHWTHQEGDAYLVTGVDKSGKRFQSRHSTWFMAECINLWQGSKWLLRKSRRYLIQKVRN